MKKLMLIAAMSLGTMTAFAQEEVTEEATANLEEVAMEAVETQDGFTEVALDALPEAVMQALEAAHPGASIAKAYVNDQAQYKLEVVKEDGEQVELYADAEGNWLEM